MKLLRNGREETPEVGLFANLTGVRCDSVVFTARDLRQMRELLVTAEGASRVQDQLGEMLCWFMPERPCGCGALCFKDGARYPRELPPGVKCNKASPCS